MCKFKVGDVVICTSLKEGFLPERLYQVATVVGLKSLAGWDSLKLSEPFNTESHYTANCFDLYEINLENK